jgi:hypothetical protein
MDGRVTVASWVAMQFAQNGMDTEVMRVAFSQPDDPCLRGSGRNAFFTTIRPVAGLPQWAQISGHARSAGDPRSSSRYE